MKAPMAAKGKIPWLWIGIGAVAYLLLRKPAGAVAQEMGMASLSVSPNPAPAYSQFTVMGSGFHRNDTISVCVLGMAPCQPTVTDNGGSFSLVYTRRGGLPPGFYTLEVFRGRRPDRAASQGFRVA
jgi:hypothetical protein